MYSIRFDTATHTLHLTLHGFWSTAMLTRFTTELAIRATALRAQYGSFAILSDSTDFAVQSAEVSKGFEKLRNRGAQTHSGPTAIVVGSMLNKLQAERSLKAPHVRVFLNVEEAREWLASERASPSA